MATPKIIIVSESLQELKKILKTTSAFLSPRVRMLIELKKYENSGISKRELAELIGVNHNSVQTWRAAYEKGGIDLLLSHKKTGYKPSVISKYEHQIIEKKLNDPNNNIRGYKELQQWIEEEFEKKIIYNTLMKYCIRKFGSSIKVGRKSHIKKDAEAVEGFKKNSRKFASKQSKAKKVNLKK